MAKSGGYFYIYEVKQLSHCLMLTEGTNTRSNIHIFHLAMKLAKDGLPISIDHLKGVTAIAIHKPEAIGCTSVGEEEGHLVHCLRSKSNEIPECIRVLKVD